MRFGTGRATASVRPSSRSAPAGVARLVACSPRNRSCRSPRKSPSTHARDRRSSVCSRGSRLVRLKGRHWIAFWLVALLAALWLVIARQTAALNAARALAELRTERASLEGRRAELDRRVRFAQSRAVLLPRAQRLGLRLPADTEIILIPTPSAPSEPPPSSTILHQAPERP